MHLRRPPCQIQLEQQAAQLERMQKTEHVLLRHAVPAPPKPEREMPAGDQITAIGDLGDAGLITGPFGSLPRHSDRRERFPLHHGRPRTDLATLCPPAVCGSGC